MSSATTLPLAKTLQGASTGWQQGHISTSVTATAPCPQHWQ